jgi:hypothetical protein
MKVKDAVARTITSARKDEKLTELTNLIKDRLPRVREQVPARRSGGRAVALVIGGAIGGLLAFLLDPQRGAARRSQLADRARSSWHIGNRKLNQLSRKIGADAYGLSKKLTHLRPANEIVDDLTLKDRVESLLYRDAEIPKGRFNVDVVGGIVRLRGQLERPEQIRYVERAVRRIPGVQGVENWLHPEGTAAPKEAVRQVSVSSRNGGQ